MKTKRHRQSTWRITAPFLAATQTALCLLAYPSSAAELDFRTGDVIAFLGGEDTVAMNEHGYLELLLTKAWSGEESPIQFRNLGWEGDTVFEQRRDLNFGSWAEQLSRSKATVLFCQFGNAEALQGTEHLAEFVTAYGHLLDEWSRHVRRIVVLSPTPFESAESHLPDLASRNGDVGAYSEAIRGLADQRGLIFIDLCQPLLSAKDKSIAWTRDGLHLNGEGHWRVAKETVAQLGLNDMTQRIWFDTKSHELAPGRNEQARQEILRKNRLWFDYWRPMNWAFLAGDRTEQPSSRDHRDPSVRWFPLEMQKFLPLIEQRESDIQSLLRQP